MRPRYSTASLLVLGTLLLGVWLWGAGCDFTRVDEGAQQPLSDIMASLATADTPQKAEQAIKRLFQKTGVGVDHKESLYDDYKFKQRDIAKLAQAHANFVAGHLSSTATFESVYDEVQHAQERLGQLDVPFVRARPVRASPEHVLEVLYTSVRHAMADPEEAENALLVALTTSDAARPAEIVPFQMEQKLSPMQRILFAVWLHKYGPSISVAASMSENEVCSFDSCPTGTELVAKFEIKGGSYVFEKPSGNENIVTVTGNPQEGTWTSTVPIDVLILKGAKDTESVCFTDAATFEGGETSGSFNNDNLSTPNQRNEADISNLQFCSNTPPEQCADLDCCIQRCQDTRLACLMVPENTQEYCDGEYKSCDAACHLQGFGG